MNIIFINYYYIFIVVIIKCYKIGFVYKILFLTCLLSFFLQGRYVIFCAIPYLLLCLIFWQEDGK